MSRLAEAYFAEHGRYPDAPGWKEPTTSRAAAPGAAEAAALRARVLAEIARAPSTADEVAAALGLSVLTVRPRVSELRALAAIERVPRLRRKNESGKGAAVWRRATKDGENR